MIQRTEARRLSSSKEWSLISSSLPPTLATLSIARLKSKIARCRRSRQKYQDLYRRQTLMSKSRLTDIPANVRTRRKKQMFDEAVDRLKRQLGKTAMQETTPRRMRRNPARTGMDSLFSKS